MDKIFEKFESKPREFPPFVFVGININKQGSGNYLEKTKYGKELHLIRKDSKFESIRTMRHKISWITNIKAEIIAGVNIISWNTTETMKEESIEILHHLIKDVKVSTEKD